MIYSIDDGKIIKMMNYDLTKITVEKLNNPLYFAKIDDEYMLVINSYKNLCFVVSKDEYSSLIELKKNDYIKNDYSLSEDNKKLNITTFIIAITYNCNLMCSYCYQQHDKSLNRLKMSEENLFHIFEVISDYMSKNPFQLVEIGLFGGEPLLPENEKLIDCVFKYCREKKIKVHIITNGYFLDYFLKKIVINRAFISSICTTVDSSKMNSLTRKPINKVNEKIESEYQIKCTKTLLYYNVPVSFSTNIDSNNINELDNMLFFLKKEGLLNERNFNWFIGRVDDRLYETHYRYIIPETELTKKLLKLSFPKNVHAAYVKTTYNLLKKMGIDFNQQELRGKYNYCWTASSIDNVFYVDNELNTFRCTYTVGRVNHSLFKFSKTNIAKYVQYDINASSYSECRGCNIAGFCGGGCMLSHSVDFVKTCNEEKMNFDLFIQDVFIPFIKEKMNSGQICQGGLSD